ncbi:MAG TPA: ATP-grasp domain-containing protein [Fimbriimonadaceae bacterium]|nr:ATP-grasp domain-containing protein [Fimbriimonadaceae bacterium]
MPRVLVLALENWLGAAHLPRALTRAGFEVSLLCYPNTLISLTRFADDRDICVPTDGAEIVARRILGLIESKPTKMCIPADDRALRFLQHIDQLAPTGQLPKPLSDLARASLPNPDAFVYGEDKESAGRLMESMGVRTPRRELIWSTGDLRDFIAEAGLPVVIKPLVGTAGQGVQVLRTDDEAKAAQIGSGRWMAQKYIAGKAAAAASVALHGKCLGTIAFEKTLTHPGETGSASVVTRLDNDEIRHAAATFAKATGFNGFYSPGYIIEEATGDAYFLEINARAVPLVPASAMLGLDLCRCLYAGIVGAPLPAQDPAAPTVLALYPQELHRDPNSPNRHLLLDEPSDDPLVHKAMQRGIELIEAGLA